MAGFNLNRCIEAIGEEFRVRMAQVAVLGPVAHGSRTDKTYGGFPMFGTSYDVFEFYRDQCSPTTYGAIPVPAINFLPLVPEPDESNPKIRAELIELFDKYKNDEPNLGRETPGFKEPRKIKIEWLVGHRCRALLREVRRGTTPAGRTAGEGRVDDDGAPPRRQSHVHGRRHRAHCSQGTARPGGVRFGDPRTSILALRPLRHRELLPRAVDALQHRAPGVLVGAAGHAAGQVLAFGHPLATIAKIAAAPFAYEIRDRVKTGLPAVLLALGSIPSVKTEVLGLSIGQPVPGPLPGPALFANLMGAHVAYELMLPKPLPIDAVKPELMKNLTATTAKKIAFGEPVNPSPSRSARPAEKG